MRRIVTTAVAIALVGGALGAPAVAAETSRPGTPAAFPGSAGVLDPSDLLELTPEPALHGIVVSWRQHDRMSVDQVHGPATDGNVQHVMNRALTDVLVLRGFDVDSSSGVGGAIVRASAA
jgi:hypothetical protein